MRSNYYAHNRVLEMPVGPSRTLQSSAAETNINTIMRKYEKTGIIDHKAKYAGRYGEAPEKTDFHEAMVLIADANTMFNDLPASIRSDFKNDPGEFLAFVSDDENLDQMVEMGLIDPPPAIADSLDREPAPELTPDPDPAPTPLPAS
jgi:phage internal scaffolding protein